MTQPTPNTSSVEQQENSLPLYFNTSPSAFEVNRLKAKQIRSKKKPQSSDNNSSKTIPGLKTNGSASTINTSNGQQKKKPSSVQSKSSSMKWSQVATKKTVITNNNNDNNKNTNNTTNNDNNNETSKSNDTNNDKETSTIISTVSQSIPTPIYKSSIEPLSVVLIRILFQKNYVPDTVPAIRPRGLINKGNICFMSSILQVLLYCTPFYNVLKAIEKKTQATLSNQSSTPLLDSILNFIEEFNPTHNKIANAANSNKDFGLPLNPENFYTTISKHSRFKHLKLGQQEDAEEFLGYFLDGLHEEFCSILRNIKVEDKEELLKTIKNQNIINNINNTLSLYDNQNLSTTTVTETDNENVSNITSSEWQEVGSSSSSSNKKNTTISKRIVEFKPTPITKLFGGQFRSELEIPRTKEPRSITLDPFQHIQLDISDDRIKSLESALTIFSEPEKISYYSSNNLENIAKKQTFIDKLPNILVIHIKRFSFINDSSLRIQKLKKKITYPHNLIIPESCLSKTLKTNKSISKSYKLTGVVYHHGSNTDVGHYTVDVLRQDKQKWIRIDDTKVENIADPNEVLGINDDDDAKSAYILIYEKNCI